MTYTIYLITNLVNGKVYVGQTGRRLKARWRGHLQESRSNSDHPLHRAIRKYGEDKFSIDPLVSVNTKEEADYQERLWILLLRAHVSQNGYVCTWGGDGRNGISWETKKKRTQSFRKTLQANPSLHPRYREDIKDDDLIRMYVEEKLTRKQISEKLNFSQPSITVRLRKHGIKVGQGRHASDWKHHDPGFLSRLSVKGPSNPAYRKDLDTEEMVRLFHQGLSSKQIAKQMGCWDSSVRYRLGTIGINFTSPNKATKVSG